MSFRTVREEIAQLRQAEEDMAGLAPVVCRERITGHIRRAEKDLRRGWLTEDQLVIDAGIEAFGIRIVKGGTA